MWFLFNRDLFIGTAKGFNPKVVHFNEIFNRLNLIRLIEHKKQKVKWFQGIFRNLVFLKEF